MIDPCPFCGGPLTLSADGVADEMLVCRQHGPVVYRGHGRDLIVEDVYPSAEEADFASPGEALRAAAPHLARLIAPRLRKGNAS